MTGARNNAVCHVVSDRRRLPRAPVRFWNAVEKTLLSNEHTPHPAFVTDQNGTRKAVILSLEHYQELLEDLDDLAVVAEQQSEETIQT